MARQRSEGRDEQDSASETFSAGGAPMSEEGRQGSQSDGSYEEEVRRRAYEAYLARGGEPGDEVEDWLAAEREVRGSRERGEGREGLS